MPTSRKRKGPDGTAVKYRNRGLVTAAPALNDPSSSQQQSSPTRAVAGLRERRAVIEDTVARLVNEARAKAGVPPLRIDERLRTAARAHSADMAKRKFCSHDNPDGVSPATRMRRAGYPDPAAENVARGQKLPHHVMASWMKSPGHRANILDPKTTAIGVGVQLGDDGPHWTQNFGY